MRGKKSRRRGHGEKKGVCSQPSHWLWLLLIIQDNTIIHLRDRHREMRINILQRHTTTDKDTHIPTMLCVNVEMFFVELSAIRWTRWPNLGGAVTVNTTDLFLLMSLTLLVTARSSCSEIGVTDPLKAAKTQWESRNTTTEWSWFNVLSADITTRHVPNIDRRKKADGLSYWHNRVSDFLVTSLLRFSGI